MEELGYFQLPGIVYRSLRHGAVHYHAKHEGMVADEWHDNGPQDLVTENLCIQIAIDKVQPPPWDTLFTTLTSANRSCEHLPTKVGYDAELQSGQVHGEDEEHADELPESVSNRLCRNLSVVQTNRFISFQSGWSQTIPVPQVKKLDVEVLGWRSYN
jgi:hypothetical protein